MHESDNFEALILDGIGVHVYVADADTWELLYLNEALRVETDAGGLCYQELHGYDTPCPFCGARNMKGRSSKTADHFTYQYKRGGETYECEARITNLPGGRRVVIGAGSSITTHVEAVETAREAGDEMSAFVQKHAAESARASELLKQEVGRRKQIEDELRELQIRYRSLFESARDAVLFIDVEGKIIHANPAADRLSVIPRHEFMGRQFFETGGIHPEDIPLTMDVYSRLMLGEDIDPIELRVLYGKETLWIEATAAALRKGNELLGFQVIARDITAKKKSEDIIRKRMAFETTVSRMAGRFVGRDGFDEAVQGALEDVANHTRASRAYLLIYTENRAKLRYAYEWHLPELPAHKPLVPFLPVETTPWGVRKLDTNSEVYIHNPDTLPPEAESEKKVMLATGTYSTYMVPLHVGGHVDGYIGFNNNVPELEWTEDDRALMRVAADIVGNAVERRRAEQALRQSEARFRRLTENSPDIIMRWTAQNYVEYANPAVKHILGVDPNSLIGTTGLLFRMLHPEDVPQIIKGLQEAGVERGVMRPDVVRIRNTNGEILWIDIVMVPIWENDQFMGVEFIGRDVTERKRAEEQRQALEQQLVQAQKMEAMGTLAGGMAHEFNNMLAVILGNAELAGRALSDGSPVRAKIDRIMTTASRARDITNRLLTFARKDKLEMRNLPVNSLVADLIDILVRTLPRKIHIKLRPHETTGNVNVDVTQLQQALLNVCINAGDAMPDGGTLGIATRVFTPDAAFLESHPEIEPGAWCAIDITDTGGGIPDDQLVKIFEPFFTTKERGRGTGLGLSITMGIIHNHGGHILVQNAAEGAIFTIYLPEVVPAPNSYADQPSTDEHGSNETVLLVDDEIEFLETTTEMLESYGYRPMPVSRGDEAVEIYRKHHGTIDIVVLDMIMKDMDGADVFRELKRIEPEVKVILCSGYSIDGQAGQLLDEGITAFVQKPFNIRRLTAKIRSILDQ